MADHHLVQRWGQRQWLLLLQLEGGTFSSCCSLLSLSMSDFTVTSGVVANTGLKNNANNHTDKLAKYSGNLLAQLFTHHSLFEKH